MLLKKIKSKEACVGIIGLGYVGLPLLLEFAKGGFPVTGLDIDQKKIDKLLLGESYIRHIPGKSILTLKSRGKLGASTDFSLVSQLDCILICVPTPLTENREPDMSYIMSTAKRISPYVKKDQLIVLESTTYPGTTSEILAPALESGCSLKANQDFVLLYLP